MIGCVTDKGNYRSKNQDRVVCVCNVSEGEKLSLACVCDGIGSFPNSEIAAEMMVDGMKDWMNGIVRYYPTTMNREELIEDLEVTIRELNDLVCEYRQDHHMDIGCTMSLLLMVNETYYIFHVGDSRIYYVSDTIMKLTQDEVVRKTVGGKEKNLLANYIGKNEQLSIFRKGGTAKKNDIFILGSDGLYKLLLSEDFQEMKEHIEQGMIVEDECRRLMNLVLERGERDNISCAIIQY